MNPWEGEWFPGAVVADTGSVADGRDPLGRVSDGWIKLRGYIFKAAYEEDDMIATKYMGRQSFDYDTWLDYLATTYEHGDVELSVCRARRSSAIAAQDNKSPPPELQHRPVVYLLFVGYQISYMFKTYLKLHFLVLGRSSDKPGMYERIGVLKHVREYARETSEADDYISGLLSTAVDHTAITIV